MISFRRFQVRITVDHGNSSRSFSFFKASTLSIFKPGSTSPSATLYDAWENFSKRSPKADESIRSIRPDLATAVDECIDAAGQEWEPKWQRRLLSVGPCESTLVNLPTLPHSGRKVRTIILGLAQSDRFREHGPSSESSQCRSILGYWHSHHLFTVGIPPLVTTVLIFPRYNYTSSMHLVNRLTSRNLHLLALRISTYLSLKPDAVLKHWACVKITKSKPSATGTGRDAELQGDDEVCQSIVEKFSKLGGGSVSYADIARKAWEVGRLDLATKVPGFGITCTTVV